MSAMANTTPLVTTVTKPATNQEMQMLPPGLTSRSYVKNIRRTSYQLSWTKSTVTDERCHRRQSAFDRLSETYSPSTTKSRPRGTDSKDHPRGRSRHYRLDTSNEDCPKDRERFCSVGESYNDSFSYSYHYGNRSRHMERRRDNESPLSIVSKSVSSNRRYRRSRSKRHKSTDEDDLTRPWMCEEVWFDELPPESIHSYKYLKAAFLAYFMQQKKYVKVPVEIHNNKQKDEETIEDFIERFRVETGRMKGAPESTAASKKKGHASWKAQDQSKRKNSDKRLWPEIKSQMVLATTSLTSFSGETIWPLGQLRLLVIIGDANHSTREWMNFMIVRSLSPYNGIIGRLGIREIQAVPSTVHGMLKFLVEGEVVTIHSTVLIPTECTSMITSSVVSKEERTRPDNFKVAVHPDFPDQEVAIGGTLSDKGRTKLCFILKKNLDIFAWQPSDMTGVPR
uniref:Reverse transcriptase domain-containing protein n=1 Tax=Tanacetum cinerariifolium TaxID=118510 RepID=A0A6L2L8Q6_TANCI|nr:reverse transcriptase domain-containing protein [Tanacetum cinerariifolium]